MRSLAGRVAPMKTFPLAAMSRDIRIVTMICFVIPAGMAIGVLLGARVLLPGLLFFPIYCWVWLLFRPTMFVIHPDSIEIVWPLKRRKIARESIVAVRMLDAKELKREVGWGMRTVGGVRLAVDAAARHCSDVSVPDGSSALAGTWQRTAMAHQPRTPGRVHPGIGRTVIPDGPAKSSKAVLHPFPSPMTSPEVARTGQGLSIYSAAKT